MASDQLGPDAWGVHRVWLDAADKKQVVADETVERLRKLVGEPPSDVDEIAPIVVRPGGLLDTGPVEVTLESGTTVDLEDKVPDDFTLGYHWCTTPSGLRRRLIVSPGRCAVPEQQQWGWAVQLYGARSRDSWGMGDLRDLRRVREWAQRQGAGFLMVSPLHAVAPTLPQEASPYLPATRRFRNPIFLCVEEVPGASPTESELEQARHLNSLDLIDRDAVWRLKDAVLRRAFSSRLDHPTRPARPPEMPGSTRQWGTWCALTLEHGPDWREWPADVPEPPDAEVAYHCWLQELLTEQLEAAAGGLTIIQDLPIGVSGGGFDAWTWDNLLAVGATVGAPPDLFNTKGQDWGSPPWVPWRMKQDNYEAFVETIRATIAGAGGLRIDHVMGLFRLWWVPDDGSAADGGYLRYPSEDLLDIVALESARAGAVVVGEDLGTVEDAVRESLAEHGMLSYRLLWFEDDDPADWPELAMAAVTTHDLPTVAGLWAGADFEDQQEWSGLTVKQAKKAAKPVLERLRRDGLKRGASPEEATLAAYTQLARSPARLLCASLEDAVGQVRRPNLPATVERPNWSLPLPLLVDELESCGLATEIAALLARAPLSPPAGRE